VAAEDGNVVSRLLPASRSRRARRVVACALALVAGAFAAASVSARPGPLGQRILAIEATHGNDPAFMIAQLRPLEAAARERRGDDLRVFLAAWGYAHAATDKTAVADAAIEELSEQGERDHDDAALASAWTLRACLFQFSGQVRSAYGWVASAVPLAQRTGDPDLRYWVDMTAADLAVSTGQIDEGVRLFTAGAIDARESHNRRREAQAWLAQAPLHLVQGQTAQALEDAARTHELGAGSTDPGLAVAGWVMESLAAEQAGDHARQQRARQAAGEAARRVPASASAVAVNSAAGGPTWLTSELDAVLQMASAHISMRHWPAARLLALRAQGLARAQSSNDREAEAAIDLGLAEIGQGQRERGREIADAGFARIVARQDADLVVQLHRYATALERAGETGPAVARLREALLLEAKLARRDRASTVVALQRQNSFEQHQRQVEQLRHDNAMQRSELERAATQRVFVFALIVALFLGVVVAAWGYRRVRLANRQLEVNNAELAFASTHDKITGLLNRRAMEGDAARLGHVPYGFVTLSVKQFGLIVGSLGHQLGDTLLCQIAARLDAVTERRDGRLYRLDGVTFGAIFRFDREGDRSETIDARLREALDAMMSVMEPAFEIGNQDLIASVSAGAARSPDHAASPQELARLAELARLRAHRETGNSYMLYDARIGESQRDKLRLEARMLKGLEHGDFEVYYQAQRNLVDGRIGGFEALLRWHDQGTMVSPAQFIPLAEESGLIVRIGAWVLRQACLQARAWADAGHGAPVVAVNISPRQFRHPDFIADVANTLRETGVDPRQIELEITEGSVMDDAEASIALLHALRAMGMQLAIDDFGTGYASLSYLRRFPLHRLKIDRSFIMQLNQGPQGDTIVRTVIELAHSLGLVVTAEGVETVEQEDALKGWRCDTVQGFLHARPSPVPAATALLVAERLATDGALSG
jgi:diguanylate cyclase (GGDEF)-like protein